MTATTPSPSTSLYSLGCAAQDIAGEIAAAAELLEDPETEGVAQGLIESYLAAQETNLLALTAKADNICRYIDHLVASADFRATQARRLKELADADHRRAEALKSYMLSVLTALHPGQTKFSLPTHELRSRTSQSVVITDPEAIPDSLLRTRTVTEPDKAAIKAALKLGTEDIPGATLKTTTNWQIK